MAFGAVLTFTTSGAATATTSPATSITASSATLNGAGNPTGGTATGWFRYATTNPGACNDAFGTRTPSYSGTNLGSGTAPVVYTQPITGLSPATTYYYCAIVSNSYGMGFGSVLQFTTPTTAPTVNTGGVTNATRTTATLGATANPGGDVTTGWFRYSTSSPGTCNDTFGTRAPATGGSALGSGNSTVTFTQPITGLTAATTYYYCAIAQSPTGTAFGAVYSFITPSSPTTVTLAATAITNNSAQLNATGNPNRASTNGWFRYSLTNPGTCNDMFGSRAPVTGSLYVGGDTSDDPFSQQITGLSSGTTYYYCAIVQSTEGTAFGAVLTFTTSGAVTVTTSAASSVASTTATLNGSGNPTGASATAWFRYSTTNPGTCNDTFGTRAPTSSGVSLGAGATSVAFAQPITGLSPGVTYYYCAIASNTYGTGLGGVLSFTTPASPPTVSTDYVTGLTSTLNGSANPNGAATTGWFRIATTSPGTCNDTFGTRLPTTGGTVLGAGSSFVSYSSPTTGLTPGTTYYYCAIAANALGTSFGIIRSFTAPMAPSVSTLAATPVTSTTATLNGSGNPNGNSTIAWFRYSTSSPGTCNDVFGTRTPDSGGTSLGAGSTATPFSAAISGLSPATTYYFCAIASSAFGTTLGSVLSFTTPPSGSSPKGTGGAPALAKSPVTTVAATALTADAATLHGSANPGGVATLGWFRYDTTDPGTCNDSFGSRAPTNGGTALGAGSQPVDYSQTLTGLLPARTYYYCALAAGSAKPSFGAVLSFTTQKAAPQASTFAPTDVEVDAATLNGAVRPGGSPALAWFRYSATDPGTCSDSFGTRVPDSGGQQLGGTVASAYSLHITGLARGTTYYYCALASSAEGATVGEVVSFVAGAAAPSVVTDPASDIDAAGATISGRVDGGDATSRVKVWFRYGATDPGTCDDSFGSRIELPAATPLGSEATPGAYAVPLTGLSASATYYYCAAASSAGGARFGQVRSFTTGPSSPSDPTAATDATASPLVMGTVSSTVDAIKPVGSGGCSYGGRPIGGSVPTFLGVLVPLLGMLLRRRRAQRG
jgi:hypothetical protein